MTRQTAAAVAIALALCTIGAALAGELDFSRSRFDPPAGAADEAGTGSLRLVFVGDCKLGGRTTQQIARHGEDYPFGLVMEELRGADIAFANYESAITTSAVQSPGKTPAMVRAGRAFVFKSDPEVTSRILTGAGIDIVQLANNHAMDYGPDGLRETLRTLNSACIAQVGAGEDWASAISPVVITVNGTRVGYIAYSAIVPPYSAAKRDSPGIAYLGTDYRAQLNRDLGLLRESCDVIVAGFHWGNEGKTIPDRNQVAIGHAAIDAGADIVIGTHPHTFQGVEFYQDGIIAYSLGNFVFTGASHKLAGGLLAIDVLPNGTLAPSLLPCWINDGRPTPSPDDKRLRDELTRIFAATRASAWPDDAGWLLLDPEG